MPGRQRAMWASATCGRVGVIGAGPAGSFLAIWLSALARKGGNRFHITLYDPRDFSQPGPLGCNMCAGVVTDSLLRPMEKLGIPLPAHLIQRKISGYVLVTKWGSAEIPIPEGRSVYSTYRGPGPLGVYPRQAESFDQFLLDCAVQRGATAVRERICGVQMPQGPSDPFRLKRSDGQVDEADILAAAFGVNSGLCRAFEGLGFGYRRPRVQKACQAELPVGQSFIEERMRSRVVVFALGYRRIRFAAFTPKREHVTATLIGSGLTREDLERFLALPQVRRFLPSGWALPGRYCCCFPALPVTAAAHPVSHRLLVIGDANVSRYLKSGIESSFFTAFCAAKALAQGRTTRQQLKAGFLRDCRRLYARDNYYGRVIFRIHDVVSRSRLLSGAHLATITAEQGSAGRRQLSELLWSLFSGGASYRRILISALSPSLQWKLAAATVRHLSAPASAAPCGRTLDARELAST